MPWVALGIGVLLCLWMLGRFRRLRAAFSSSTLKALGRALPEMRERALATGTGVFHSAALLMVYGIREGDSGWIHHVSASSSSPSNAAGTFFLAVGRAAFHLDERRPDVFVTQRRVFHLEVILDEEEHRAALEQPITVVSPSSIREAGRFGLESLLSMLVVRNVPLPPMDGRPVR
jgi:hypothetical protein